MPGIAKNKILKAPVIEGFGALQTTSNSGQILESFVCRLLRIQTQGSIMRMGHRQ